MNPINLNHPTDADALRRQQRAEAQPPTNPRRAGTPDAAAGERHDKLNVSDRGAGVSRLVEKTNALPDVRRERVEALRQQVASGDYNPPAADIAAAILRDEH
jgi:negative regulator of flagellin synthesis FlgM